MEMLREAGYCHGIENYSRLLSDRPQGSRPYTLLDYFPKDFLVIIDESHVTIPQLNGMYEGDRSRKKTLVEHGFRIPSCLDNRPLKFKEFCDNHRPKNLRFSDTRYVLRPKRVRAKLLSRLSVLRELLILRLMLDLRKAKSMIWPKKFK